MPPLAAGSRRSPPARAPSPPTSRDAAAAADVSSPRRPRAARPPRSRALRPPRPPQQPGGLDERADPGYSPSVRASAAEVMAAPRRLVSANLEYDLATLPVA